VGGGGGRGGIFTGGLRARTVVAASQVGSQTRRCPSRPSRCWRVGIMARGARTFTVGAEAALSMPSLRCALSYAGIIECAWTTTWSRRQLRGHNRGIKLRCCCVLSRRLGFPVTALIRGRCENMRGGVGMVRRAIRCRGSRFERLGRDPLAEDDEPRHWLKLTRVAPRVQSVKRWARLLERNESAEANRHRRHLDNTRQEGYAAFGQCRPITPSSARSKSRPPRGLIDWRWAAQLIRAVQPIFSLLVERHDL